MVYGSCFLYLKYFADNNRNRCIAKKLPGAEWIYYIHDKADRLILSQDGEQRTRDEWTFNIPDIHGRVVLNGTCSNEVNYPVQLDVVVVGTWANTTNEYKGYTLEGIALDEVKDLTVNYYDSYEFMGNTSIFGTNHDNFGFESQDGLYQQAESSKGLHTGTITAILDESYIDTKLITVMYYDYRGRVIQKKTGNLLNGVDKQYTHYTFTGQPIYSKHIHTADQKQSLTEYHTYTYDHAERLLKVEHQLKVDETNNEKITLLECTYDELGRLQSKSLHGNENNKIMYAYNVRNWLTGINSNSFYQNLYYNTGQGEALYNGNISSMIWKANDPYIRGYKFNYDGLNRLVEANYGEGELIITNPGRFTERVTKYDKHGNIEALQRHGKATSNMVIRFGMFDNLWITYSGNQIKNIMDFAIDNPTSPTFHFKMGSDYGNQYQYNANGNLIKDSNKNITNIKYNILNLPEKVQLSDNRSITYLYDAAGKIQYELTHLSDRLSIG